MSLYINFEPHSWYKGFAIRDRRQFDSDPSFKWEAVTDDGMTYTIVTRYASTLTELKKQITQYRSR